MLLAVSAAQAQTSTGQHAAPPPRAKAGSGAAKGLTEGAGTAPDPAVIVLDPAHGGTDDGAHLAGGRLEKDVTLAFAIRLRDLLAQKGFKPVLTRTNSGESGTPPLPDDQRAEVANRSNASACLLLHASSGGHGVHLYTSSLHPLPPSTRTRLPRGRAVLPWDSAQSAALTESVALRSSLAAAITGSRIPLVAGRASIHPIDSMTCPAVLVELAPYTPDDADTVLPPSDSQYQESLARTIVTALIFRRQQLQGAAAGSEPRPAPSPNQHAPKQSTSTHTARTQLVPGGRHPITAPPLRQQRKAAPPSTRSALPAPTGSPQ